MWSRLLRRGTRTCRILVAYKFCLFCLGLVPGTVAWRIISWRNNLFMHMGERHAVVCSVLDVGIIRVPWRHNLAWIGAIVGVCNPNLELCQCICYLSNLWLLNNVVPKFL